MIKIISNNFSEQLIETLGNGLLVVLDEYYEELDIIFQDNKSEEVRHILKLANCILVQITQTKRDLMGVIAQLTNYFLRLKTKQKSLIIFKDKLTYEYYDGIRRV